jgi:hypothetical protein
MLYSQMVVSGTCFSKHLLNDVMSVFMADSLALLQPVDLVSFTLTF